MSKDEKFITLFRENYQKIYNLVLRMHSDRTAAQDITQDIFIKIYENLDKYEGRSNPGTWIYSIAMNHCIDFLRRERSFTGKLQKIFFSVRASRHDSEDTIIERNLGMEILRRMSPPNRALIILKVHLGLDYEEIASVMHMTAASVGVQLTRARKEALKITKELGICHEV